MRRRYGYLAAALLPICMHPQAADSLRVSAAPELTTTVRVERLKINSRQADFSPFLYRDTLYFVSERPNDVGVQFEDNSGATNIADIYFAPVTGGVPRKPRALPRPVNSPWHEGPLCIGPSGSIYFTGNDRRTGKLQIYQCRKNGENYDKPERLEIMKDSISFCHPSLTAGGDTLFFSADAGGQMDLHFSVMRNGTWSLPERLPNEINSDSNEVFPFYRNGRLFFASSRPGGFGNLDIYGADLSEMSVRNLGPPVNSPSDDFGIWTDSSFANGYFSSSRGRGTGDDVYAFTRVVPDFAAAKIPAVRNTFCYTLFEENTIAQNDTLDLEFEWDLGDGHKARGPRVRHCFPAAGNYTVSLNVVEKLSGELFSAHTSYVLEVAEPEKLYIASRDTVNQDEPLVLEASRSAVKGYDIESWYWNFGDSTYSTGPIVRHIYRREGNYEVWMCVEARHRETGKKELFKTNKKITALSKIE